MATELLQPGELVRLFDGSSGTPPHQSAVFAMPISMAKVITWTYKFASAPDAVSIKIQVSDDVAGPWTDLDTGTATAGATRTTDPTNAAFVRAERTSQTAGGNVTVIASVGY